MAVVRVNDHPFLSVNDELIIVNRDFETRATVYVKSLTSSATVSVRSGSAIGTYGADTVLQLPGLGTFVKLDFPVGGNPRDRITSVIISNGQVEASIVSPSEFRSYLTVQTT